MYVAKGKFLTITDRHGLDIQYQFGLQRGFLDRFGMQFKIHPRLFSSRHSAEIKQRIDVYFKLARALRALSDPYCQST